jgi:hypothetical protein
MEPILAVAAGVSTGLSERAGDESGPENPAPRIFGLVRHISSRIQLQ